MVDSASWMFSFITDRLLLVCSRRFWVAPKVRATDLIKLAAQRLSTAAADNGRFKVGSTLTTGVITITEKEGGVDYSKNNLAGWMFSFITDRLLLVCSRRFWVAPKVPRMEETLLIEGGVDYSKNNLAGTDGKGTGGNAINTNKATATDWAGLVKTGGWRKRC